MYQSWEEEVLISSGSISPIIYLMASLTSAIQSKKCLTAIFYILQDLLPLCLISWKRWQLLSWGNKLGLLLIPQKSVVFNIIFEFDMLSVHVTKVCSTSMMCDSWSGLFFQLFSVIFLILLIIFFFISITQQETNLQYCPSTKYHIWNLSTVFCPVWASLAWWNASCYHPYLQVYT